VQRWDQLRVLFSRYRVEYVWFRIRRYYGSTTIDILRWGAAALRGWWGEPPARDYKDTRPRYTTGRGVSWG
jgi:hypothetical protein